MVVSVGASVIRKIFCGLDGPECRSAASFYGVDGERRALSESGKNVLDSIGAVAIAAKVGEENLAPIRIFYGFE